MKQYKQEVVEVQITNLSRERSIDRPSSSSKVNMGPVSQIKYNPVKNKPYYIETKAAFSSVVNTRLDIKVLDTIVENRMQKELFGLSLKI